MADDDRQHNRRLENFEARRFKKGNNTVSKANPKPYKPESTDLALTPPQKDWSKEALDSRMQKHADAIEKATADAPADDSDGPTTADPYPTKTDLSKFGF
jgi:hypothetical protein